MNTIIAKLGWSLWWATSLMAATVLAQTTTNPPGPKPQQNILPNMDIPTATYDPAEDADPDKLRAKLMRQLLKAKKYDQFQAEYSLNPSAEWATALAWAYYKDDRFSAAREWFKKALVLDPTYGDATHGLAVLHQHLNHSLAASGPGSAQIQKANECFQQKNYQRALDYLAESEKLAPLGRGARMLRAWSYFQLGQTALAATLFEELYREKKDKESADGVCLSLQRLEDWEALEKFAAVEGGPLSKSYHQALAQEYYDRGLFLAAEKTAPGKFPALQNIDSDSVSLGGGIREKSGDVGLSRLSAIYGPTVETKLYFDGVDQLSFTLQRLDLDSGHMNSDALFGSVPLQPAPFTSAPRTTIDNLLIPTIRFSHEGWTTPYAELGTTPLNAPVSPLPTGKLGLIQQIPGGYWQVEAFSKSNTESILSYSGAIDPYTGKSFGRVIETGIHGSAFHDLGSDWGIFGSSTAGWLLGDNVEDNQHLGGSISVARNIPLEDFTYFSIGPVFSLDHYEQNLSHFTLGQGGYFSPNYIAQGLAALNFLTREGQQFIFRGNAGVGEQINQQASSAFFPLNDDGRSYASSTDSSPVFNIRLEGVARLSDHWQVGGEIGFEQSASYESRVGFIFFRYLFEPRPAVFSSDLSSFSP